VLNVNAKGVFLCAKAEIPYLKKQEWGRIINIASIASKIGVSRFSSLQCI
jgi:meso-butanediol dehydrogenase/(S,S)-butanediol dehydrogenase/diacetyl reductase